MSIADKILAKRGLKYDNLLLDEKETLNAWVKAITDGKVNDQTIKDHIQKMKHAVETELSKDKMENPSFWAFLFKFKKDVGLKARLRNYMLLEAFLVYPDKAKQELERQIGSLSGGKN